MCFSLEQKSDFSCEPIAQFPWIAPNFFFFISPWVKSSIAGSLHSRQCHSSCVCAKDTTRNDLSQKGSVRMNMNSGVTLPRVTGSGAESPSLGNLPMCQGMNLLTPRSLKKMLRLRLLYLPNRKLFMLKVAWEASGLITAISSFWGFQRHNQISWLAALSRFIYLMPFCSINSKGGNHWLPVSQLACTASKRKEGDPEVHCCCHRRQSWETKARAERGFQGRRAHRVLFQLWKDHLGRGFLRHLQPFILSL